MGLATVSLAAVDLVDMHNVSLMDLPAVGL